MSVTCSIMKGARGKTMPLRDDITVTRAGPNEGRLARRCALRGRFDALSGPHH